MAENFNLEALNIAHFSPILKAYSKLLLQALKFKVEFWDKILPNSPLCSELRVCACNPSCSIGCAFSQGLSNDTNLSFWRNPNSFYFCLF